MNHSLWLIVHTNNLPCSLYLYTYFSVTGLWIKWQYPQTPTSKRLLLQGLFEFLKAWHYNNVAWTTVITSSSSLSHNVLWTIVGVEQLHPSPSKKLYIIYIIYIILQSHITYTYFPQLNIISIVECTYSFSQTYTQQINRCFL